MKLPLKEKQNGGVDITDIKKNSRRGSRPNLDIKSRSGLCMWTTTGFKTRNGQMHIRIKQGQLHWILQILEGVLWLGGHSDQTSRKTRVNTGEFTSGVAR